MHYWRLSWGLTVCLCGLLGPRETAVPRGGAAHRRSRGSELLRQHWGEGGAGSVGARPHGFSPAAPSHMHSGRGRLQNVSRRLGILLEGFFLCGGSIETRRNGWDLDEPVAFTQFWNTIHNTKRVCVCVCSHKCMCVTSIKHITLNARCGLLSAPMIPSSQIIRSG